MSKTTKSRAQLLQEDLAELTKKYNCYLEASVSIRGERVHSEVLIHERPEKKEEEHAKD